MLHVLKRSDSSRSLYLNTETFPYRFFWDITAQEWDTVRSQWPSSLTGKNLISQSLSRSGQLFQIWMNSLKAFLRYHACNKGPDGWTEGQPENKSSVQGYLWHRGKTHWLQDGENFPGFQTIAWCGCTFSLMLTLQSARLTVKITTAQSYKLFLMMPDDM